MFRCVRTCIAAALPQHVELHILPPVTAMQYTAETNHPAIVEHTAARMGEALLLQHVHVSSVDQSVHHMPLQVWPQQCVCGATAQIPLVWWLEDRVQLWLQLAFERHPDQRKGRQPAGDLLHLSL